MRFTADSSDARGRFGFYDFGIQAMTMARRSSFDFAQDERSRLLFLNAHPERSRRASIEEQKDRNATSANLDMGNGLYQG